MQCCDNASNTSGYTGRWRCPLEASRRVSSADYHHSSHHTCEQQQHPTRDTGIAHRPTPRRVEHECPRGQRLTHRTDGNHQRAQPASKGVASGPSAHDAQQRPQQRDRRKPVQLLHPDVSRKYPEYPAYRIMRYQRRIPRRQCSYTSTARFAYHPPRKHEQARPHRPSVDEHAHCQAQEIDHCRIMFWSKTRYDREQGNQRQEKRRQQHRRPPLSTRRVSHITHPTAHMTHAHRLTDGTCIRPQDDS